MRNRQCRYTLSIFWSAKGWSQAAETRTEVENSSERFVHFQTGRRREKLFCLADNLEVISLQCQISDCSVIRGGSQDRQHWNYSCVTSLHISRFSRPNKNGKTICLMFKLNVYTDIATVLMLIGGPELIEDMITMVLLHSILCDHARCRKLDFCWK